VRAAVRGLVLAGLLATAACTGTSSDPDPGRTIQPGPQRSELIAAADLDPCPASSAATGGDLPDTTLPCLGEGPAVHLSGLRGKPLVMNIWGSWCGPCQKETPYFAQVYDELKHRVQFLGIDDEDDPDSALDFAAHVSPAMRYPSVVDEDKKVLLGIGPPVAVPSTLFIAADGTLVHRESSAYTSAAQLRDDIDEFLDVSG
jgi:cytochrome c biogenesis protein CcmG/thiol:disulfide interchange protein DsbE